ncbi:MAG: SusD/RagB family nutrient-binding outer membrane lipoprotein [Chitinophagales bacterium]
MKNIIKISIMLSLAAGLFVMPGCKKLEDTNLNPNNPESVTPSVQLTATELQIGYGMGGDYARYAGLYTQYLVGVDRQFAVYTSYSFSGSDFDQIWQNQYLSMANLKDLERHSLQKGYNHYAGISEILMAYCLGSNTAVWGDVPYSDAFKGLDQLQPKFDSQQGLYDTVQALLDRGIASLALEPGGAVPGADDIVYGGNASAWTHLAYALKARYYLHIRKQNSSAANNAMVALGNAFTSSGDDAYFHFGTTPKSANPMWQFDDQRGGYISYVSGYAIEQMVAMSDPRLDDFVDTAKDGLGTFYGNPESPVQIMTYAEQKFIEAEVDFINGDHTSAATAHNTAVMESIAAINGSPDSAYEAANAVETDVTITLEKIMTQKYFALYMNPEAFSDWRRTGFPAISPFPGSVSAIPRRFLYPETEVERNKNTPTGVMTTDKVWWDI